MKINKYKDQLSLTLQDILHDLDHILKMQDLNIVKEEIERIYALYDWSLEKLIAKGDNDGKSN